MSFIQPSTDLGLSVASPSLAAFSLSSSSSSSSPSAFPGSVDCPSCLEPFSSTDGPHYPRILLPCAHTICSSCISNQLAIRGPGQFRCLLHSELLLPTIRQTSDVKANFALIELISKIQQENEGSQQAPNIPSQLAAPIISPQLSPIGVAASAAVDMVHLDIPESFVRSIDVNLCQPRGVTVHGELLFVADYSTNRVQVFNSYTGKLMCEWGSHGKAELQFNRPFSIAVEDEIVYVMDPNANAVESFTLNGVFQRMWNINKNVLTPSKPLYYPFGLAVSDGLLYVANSHCHRIQVFETATGELKHEWGNEGTAMGQFICPTAVAVDNRLVYVADTGNHRIQMFTLDGRAMASSIQLDANEQLDGPRGIAVADGLIYVADYGHNKVQIFESVNCQFHRAWGCKGTAKGQFTNPIALAVNDGLVYVADAGNNRIQVFRCS